MEVVITDHLQEEFASNAISRLLPFLCKLLWGFFYKAEEIVHFCKSEASSCPIGSTKYPLPSTSKFDPQKQAWCLLASRIGLKPSQEPVLPGRKPFSKCPTRSKGLQRLTAAFNGVLFPSSPRYLNMMFAAEQNWVGIKWWLWNRYGMRAIKIARLWRPDAALNPMPMLHSFWGLSISPWKHKKHFSSHTDSLLSFHMASYVRHLLSRTSLVQNLFADWQDLPPSDHPAANKMESGYHSRTFWTTPLKERLMHVRKNLELWYVYSPQSWYFWSSLITRWWISDGDRRLWVWDVSYWRNLSGQ